MATTKKHTPRQSGTGDFGLLANGVAGPWEVAVDEATSGANRWNAQLDGPSVTFSFEIPSLEIITKMIRFLAPPQVQAKASANGAPEGSGTLLIGRDKKAPITMVRDDEFQDRFFLVVGPAASPLVRFVLVGKDVAHIAEALQQVQQDIDDAG